MEILKEILKYANIILAISASALYLKKFFTTTPIRLYYLVFVLDSLIVGGVYILMAIGVYIPDYVIRMCFTLLLVTFITNYIVSCTDIGKVKGC